MDCHFHIRVGLFLCSLFSTGLAFYYAGKKGKSNSLLWQVFRLQVLMLIWTSCDLLRFYMDDYCEKMLLIKLEFGAVCFVGFSWLVFCLSYVESSWLTKHRYWYLFIWPLLCYLTLLTNDLHYGFFRFIDRNVDRFGLFFYCHLGDSVLYSMIGAGLLLVYAFRQYRYSRWQSFWLIVAGLLPVLVNLLFLANGINHDEFLFTPLYYTISSLILMIAILKYKFLDILPIALDKIADQIKEIFIVTDNKERIIDFNPAAVATFPELSQVKLGEPFPAALECLRKSYQLKNQAEDKLLNSGLSLASEIYLEKTNCWFSVKTQPICTNNLVLGQIFSLNDITEYKRLESELQQKNSELVFVNRQLQEQAAMVAELAIVKERDRIVQDIHDTLGQTMTLLITTLQLCKLQSRDNPEGAEAKLDQAMQFANQAVLQTRQALYGLVAPLNDNLLLSVFLPDLISEFVNSGMQVQLSCTGVEYPLNQRAMKIILHLCREGLTNALRHGKAEHLTIKLDFAETHLAVEVRDDGLECKACEAGIGLSIGLSAVKQRVQSLNGRISFNSYLQSGFMILAEIPKSQLVPETYR